MLGRDGIENEIEATRILDENSSSLVAMKSSAPSLSASWRLPGEWLEHGDMGAEGVSKLYCHMAKAAEADHGKLVAGF